MKYVLFLLIRELGTVGGRNSGVRGDQYFHQKIPFFSGADIFLGFSFPFLRKYFSRCFVIIGQYVHDYHSVLSITTSLAS